MLGRGRKPTSEQSPRLEVAVGLLFDLIQRDESELTPHHRDWAGVSKAQALQQLHSARVFSHAQVGPFVITQLGAGRARSRGNHHVQVNYSTGAGVKEWAGIVQVLVRVTHPQHTDASPKQALRLALVQFYRYITPPDGSRYLLGRTLDQQWYPVQLQKVVRKLAVATELDSAGNARLFFLKYRGVGFGWHINDVAAALRGNQPGQEGGQA